MTSLQLWDFVTIKNGKLRVIYIYVYFTYILYIYSHCGYSSQIFVKILVATIGVDLLRDCWGLQLILGASRGGISSSSGQAHLPICLPESSLIHRSHSCLHGERWFSTCTGKLMTLPAAWWSPENEWLHLKIQHYFRKSSMHERVTHSN